MSLDSEDVTDLLTAAADPQSQLLEEMTEYGREIGFHIVGPETGQFLRTIAAASGARRVFEFGSGFGYSAAWFAEVLPDDGDLVLTDFDADNLTEAEEFLARSDFAGEIHYEVGDALTSFARHDGPWDVVLIDHHPSMYADTLELVRPELADGAVLVADNILRGAASPSELRDALDGANSSLSEEAEGTARYVQTVCNDDAFETSIAPIGNGLAISVYHP